MEEEKPAPVDLHNPAYQSTMVVLDTENQTTAGDGEAKCGNIFPGCKKFMEGASDETVAMRKRPSRVACAEDQALIKLTLAAEAWRFIAYCMFWSMCLFAIILTQTIVKEKLAAGPEKDGDTCGPFDISNGKGFNLTTEGHLVQAFGYSNICANWDYSPSRELTGMFYPLFEYPLLIYIVLDFITVQLAYKRREVTRWFMILSKVLVPITFILCSWFRMIFIVAVYDSVSGHTAGFLGLQIALVLVTIQNTLYVLETQVAYSFLGGLYNTRMAAIVYLSLTLTISMVKVVSSFYVVIHSAAAPWTLVPVVGSIVTGQVVDWIWMVFNAVLPLGISYARAKSEHPLLVTIGIKEQKYFAEDDDGQETATLISSSSSSPTTKEA